MTVAIFQVTPAQFRLDFSVRPGDAQQLELWRFALSPMHVLSLPDERDASRFQVDITSYQFADIAVSCGSSSASLFERTMPTIARSGIDHICVIVHLTGGFELDADGRTVEVQPGDVCILDLSRPSTLRTTDYRSLSAIMPRALVAPLIPDLDALHGLILKGESPLGKMLVSHLQSLYREAPSLNVPDARTAARGTASLLATFAGAAAHRSTATARTVALSHLHAVRRMIEEHLADPELGPDFLSRRLGMSRATLYRLVEPIGGVREYIQQRRLMRAYQMITDPARQRERIGHIAAACGFTSDSVFSRAFREAFGMAPSELRTIAGQTGTADVGALPQSPFVMMNRWLIGMDMAGR